MTKKELTLKIKIIIGNHDGSKATPYNEKTRGLSKDPLLFDLFAYHNDYDRWCAEHDGICHFEIKRQHPSMHGGKWNEINIHMSNGYIRKSASYKHCLDRMNPNFDSDRSSKHIAMRHSITRKHGSGKKGMHLDHAGDYPFKRIAALYISNNPDLMVDIINPTNGGSIFTEERYEDFIIYHDSLAKLELIPAIENLRKSK